MYTSDNLHSKRHALIPGGAHTYSRGDDQYPHNAPPILSRGKGSYVWDPQGTKYLDYGMALRAITIGYADERVNRAAQFQMEQGVNLTRPSEVELRAAETIVDLIPSAEMVKFAKNGSTVTTAAVKIARAYTNRKYVCIPRQHPFFSYDDWFIGTTPMKRGIPPEHYSLTLQFDYNNISSLERLFSEYPNQIACVLLEPATSIHPCPSVCGVLRQDHACSQGDLHERNFLVQVQAICRRHGALFILDEMITGFRWHLNGAQAFFGVDPDLSTFGKGMANGFAVAALVGKREFMKVGSIDEEGGERTFLISTTHGAEMVGLGAFLETMKIYQEEEVVQHLWSYGDALFAGVNEISRSKNLQDYVFFEGSAIAMNLVTRDANGEFSWPFKTLVAQELMKSRIIMPWVAICKSHTDTELRITLDAFDKALTLYRRALSEGVEQFLEGPVLKPVFRKFN